MKPVVLTLRRRFTKSELADELEARFDIKQNGISRRLLCKAITRNDVIAYGKALLKAEQDCPYDEECFNDAMRQVIEQIAPAISNRCENLRKK